MHELFKLTGTWGHAIERPKANLPQGLLRAAQHADISRGLRGKRSTSSSCSIPLLCLQGLMDGQRRALASREIDGRTMRGGGARRAAQAPFLALLADCPVSATLPQFRSRVARCAEFMLSNCLSWNRSWI